MNKKTSLWDRMKRFVCEVRPIGLALDVSRMDMDDGFIERMSPLMQRAFDEMAALESGAVANPDEGRMVGHYWLRAPELAPSAEIRKELEEMQKAIKRFAIDVHEASVRPQHSARFTQLLSIGIGGSALGPQFVSDVLGSAHDRMKVYFMDNTDPDGFDRIFSQIGNRLKETLTIVISKSGGTIETRNGMLEAAAAYRSAGLEFARHAVAITQLGSRLDNIAKKEGWIARFPMWDWVGGRTSEFSAVGLLPAALQGVDIDGMLKGARLCDEATRTRDIFKNPAALLALSWYHATDGRGKKDMVILPYKDRLSLFPRYLQQLVMESLGKERDRAGNVVNQGIAVYGNKGSTDQHSYLQQLREGVNNFFATFIEVLQDRQGKSIEVEPGITSGDYLSAFLHGTRNALYENGRLSITITMERLDAAGLGALIALYERAVGLYASTINVNAYHQPGVEAGKKMAAEIISLQHRVMAFMRNSNKGYTAEEVAAEIGEQGREEAVFRILEHARANQDHRIIRISGEGPSDSRYQYSAEQIGLK